MAAAAFPRREIAWAQRPAQDLAACGDTGGEQVHP